MTLSGTVSASALNAEFDAFRASLWASIIAGRERQHFIVRALDVVAGTDIRDRCIVFSPDDDMIVSALCVDVVGHASTAIVTAARLEALDALGNNVSEEYLLGEDLVVSEATADATRDTERALSFPTLAGERTRGFVALLRGVRYRLSVEVDHAADAAQLAQATLTAYCERRRM